MKFKSLRSWFILGLLTWVLGANKPAAQPSLRRL